MPCLFVAVWVCGLLIGVSDQQKIARFQIVRQLKFFSDDIGLEVADPHAAQTKFGSLQHHVIGQDWKRQCRPSVFGQKDAPMPFYGLHTPGLREERHRCWRLFPAFSNFLFVRQQSGGPVADLLRLARHGQLAGFYQVFLFLPFCYCSGAQSISFLQSQ